MYFYLFDKNTVCIFFFVDHSSLFLCKMQKLMGSQQGIHVIMAILIDFRQQMTYLCT